LEMSWSSDSNVLAVWIRADEGDFGKCRHLLCSGFRHLILSVCGG
jgi:hypothetical protein